MHRYFLLILLLCNVVVASAENIGRNQANKSSAVTIHYQGYSVSYNPDLLIPNWVSYELLADETDGPFTRKGKYFRQDSSTKVKQADNEDYKRSGWSRGHMAPAGDFKWNDEAMWETFYYTNCCPQDESLNSGLWNSLEMKVRGWAKKFGSIKVITGPLTAKSSQCMKMNILRLGTRTTPQSLSDNNAHIEGLQIPAFLLTKPPTNPHPLAKSHISANLTINTSTTSTTSTITSTSTSTITSTTHQYFAGNNASIIVGSILNILHICLLEAL